MSTTTTEATITRDEVEHFKANLSHKWSRLARVAQGAPGKPLEAKALRARFEEDHAQFRRRTKLMAAEPVAIQYERLLAEHQMLRASSQLAKERGIAIPDYSGVPFPDAPGATGEP